MRIREANIFDRYGFPKDQYAQAGGSVAGNARRDLEQRLGRPVVTSANAAQLNHVVTQMIEASASAADDESTDSQSQESPQ